MRKKLNTTINIVRLIGSHLSELESRLWIAGDRAHALRDDETLRSIASHDTLVAQYWRAVCLSRAGHREEASDVLQSVIAIAPAPLQAKALVTLGGIHLFGGDYQRASHTYAQAQRVAGDPLTALGIKRMQGVLLSIAGQHSSSLDEMEAALPLLRSIPSNHPVRLDFYNSCAVELIAVGRLEQARPLVEIITSSPLISVYPEWATTAQDLSPDAAPTSVKGPRHPRLEPEPARILTFPERPVESEVARQARAVLVACHTESRLAITTILKIERASEDRLQVCCDLLDGSEPNMQLAAWASKASPEDAASVLRMAKRTASAEREIVRQMKRD